MSLHACNTPAELVPGLFYCTSQKCRDLREVDHHDRQQTERCHAAVGYVNFHRGHDQRQSRWHPACSVHYWSCRRHSVRKDKRLSQDNDATEKRRPGVYQLKSPLQQVMLQLSGAAHSYFHACCANLSHQSSSKGRCFHDFEPWLQKCRRSKV